MKYHKIFVFILFCCCVTLFSCKKDHTKIQSQYVNHSPHLSYPFVKSQTSSVTNTYYYDTLGRLVWNGFQFYSYSPDTVYANGAYYVTLNSNGFVTSKSDQSEAVYTYDSVGHVIDVKQTGTNYEDTYYYQNNNLMAIVSRRDSSSMGISYQAVFYSYNSNISTIGNYNFGLPYLGKPSVNLVDSMYSVQGFTYNFNVEAMRNSPPFNKSIYYYTYNSSGWVASCSTTAYTYEGPQTYVSKSLVSYDYY